MLNKQLVSAVVALTALCAGLTGKAYADDTDQYRTDEILVGDYAQAEQKLLAQLKQDPNDPYVILNLAVVYRTTGRLDEARAMYDRILSQRDNPYAQVADGKVKPVKSIAKVGKATLNEVEAR